MRIIIEDAEAADRIARAFHETYETLAPQFGYKTRDASAVSWDQVPAANKDLMTAVVGTLLTNRIIIDGGA
jgi:hypothetical protein